MIIKVRVIPNSRSESVKKIGESSYVVKVRERALDGRANDAAAKVLADHFNTRRSQVSILDGARSRDKTVEVRTV